MHDPTYDDAQRDQMMVSAPAYVAVADDTPNLQPGQFTVRLNQSGNTLVFVVKYRDGTMKSGTIALT